MTQKNYSGRDYFWFIFEKIRAHDQQQDLKVETVFIRAAEARGNSITAHAARNDAQAFIKECRKKDRGTYTLPRYVKSYLKSKDMQFGEEANTAAREQSRAGRIIRTPFPAYAS